MAGEITSCLILTVEGFSIVGAIPFFAILFICVISVIGVLSVFKLIMDVQMIWEASVTSFYEMHDIFCYKTLYRLLMISVFKVLSVNEAIYWLSAYHWLLVMLIMTCYQLLLYGSIG